MKESQTGQLANSGLDGFTGGLLLLAFICVWATWLGGFSHIDRPPLIKATRITK